MNRDRCVIIVLALIVVALGFILVNSSLRSQTPSSPFISMRPPFGRDDAARAVCIELLTTHKEHMQLLETHADGTVLTDAGGGSYIVNATFRAELAAEIAVIDQLILDLQ